MAAARKPGEYVSPTVPDPGIRVGRFRVLRRVDGPLIVVDEARPLGQRTVWTGEKGGELGKAADVCRRLSDEATARGEPNDG